MIEVPPHDFVGKPDPMAHERIMTPELQVWAAGAAMQLAAAGWPVPADLECVRDGQTLTRNRWDWLLDSVLRPRPACLF